MTSAPSSIFTEYASYYDLIYRDKDYAGESLYINELIRSNNPGAVSILNLGCGSGRHDLHLTGKGYLVTGVDISEEMLHMARRNSVGNQRVAYIHGDISTLRLGRRFDAVTALFHVICYQTTNDQIRSAFDTVRQHLNEDGIFIFDCWYGPGVLTDRPDLRIKELEDEDITVTRTANPVLHPASNTVDVNYHILIRGKKTGAVKEIVELHTVRYLFLPEIEMMLEAAGMSVVDAHVSMKPGALPELGTWNLTVVARPAARSIKETLS
jgi:SAM-dependent methyltransferase